ncbi:polymer-forming cytoskeletal protein [Alicyclobacillus sendaiensis]|uniref:polymer-forming cytoskeletal protein n=1 Tax=Alicyclobacillus sendaiensis TaxID=192387 RepID=UPI000AD23CB2|nr:polymer-forming cytoskeletal protein [Alicyclobacillus sendaiensis]
MWGESHMAEDLEVSGRATLGGGAYRKVEVNGTAKMQGDVSCERCEVNGSAHVGGRMDVTEKFEVNGRVTVNGSIRAGAFEVNGLCDVAGDCEVGSEAEIAGMAKIGRGLKAARVHVGGRARVGGPIEADRICVTGSVECRALMNADEIEFELMGKSRVREIGCTTITTRVGKGGWFSKPRLEVEVMEGDRIEVEAVLARRIRGDVVVLGDGCEVDRVEYRTAFERRGSAVVGEAVQL